MVLTVMEPIIDIYQDDVQFRIQQALNDGFTGLMRVEFMDGKNMSVFAVNGSVAQVYIRNHRLPTLDWERELQARGEGKLTRRPISANGIRFEKILLEHINPVQPQPAFTIQLPAMFDLAKRNQSATLFHICWKNAEGFVMIAGGNLPVVKAILQANNSAADGLAALDQIMAWNEADCMVSTYRGDIKCQAWLEAHLNILFEWSCSYILQQYAKLTGLVMVNLIVRSLKVNAVQNKCEINANGANLTDSTVFSSAAEMSRAYRQMKSMIEGHVEPVIGSALLKNILDQVKLSMRGVYVSIAEATEYFR